MELHRRRKRGRDSRRKRKRWRISRRKRKRRRWRINSSWRRRRTKVAVCVFGDMALRVTSRRREAAKIMRRVLT